MNFKREVKQAPIDDQVFDRQDLLLHGRFPLVDPRSSLDVPRKSSPLQSPVSCILHLLLCLPGITFGQFSLQDAFPSLPSFSLPVEIVSAPDGTGRLFVVEQRGRIYVLSNSSSNPTRKLFINLSGLVSPSGFETGLLGMAFHPNYAANGFFYVNYTRTTDSLRTYVVRYRVSPSNPDSARTDSTVILLTQTQPFTNHNGGKLLFGPDGYLYISFGDGGSGGDPGNRAQSISTFLGKILRIDVDESSDGFAYAIPQSNPFIDSSGSVRKEIYAYGLRNPWKMSFDIAGRLWAADVGQAVSEEINEIRSGGNYGWRIMEGFSCYNPATGCDTTGLTLPRWVYTHPDPAAGSITGGFIYAGTAIPSLAGKYIYGDYVDGRLWAFTVDGPSSGTNVLLLDSPEKISSFGEDSAGELLIASLQSGRILRLTGPATGFEGVREEIPRTAMLHQNYPNPFNGRTNFGVRIATSGRARLEIFDVWGRTVDLLVDRELPRGYHGIGWNTGNLPSGMYLARLTAGTTMITKRLMLVR